MGVGVRDFGRPNIEMVLIRVDPAGELSVELVPGCAGNRGTNGLTRGWIPF